LSVSRETIRPGETSTIRLELIDDARHAMDASIACKFTVTFQQTDGPVNSSGRISETRYIGANVFEATFTALHAGSPTFINARINGTLVQICNARNKMPTITVCHFWPAKPMHLARAFHTGTALRDGQVLAVGGIGDADHGARALLAAEVFSPDTREWTLLANSSQVARASHTATILNPPDTASSSSSSASSGTRVWLAGGLGDTWQPTASCETFDSLAIDGAGSFATSASLAVARFHHTAVRLAGSSGSSMEGIVLVAGGLLSSVEPEPATNTMELYDPIHNTMTTCTTHMQVARGGHTCSVLPDGNLLFAGGQHGTAVHASLELFDPSNQTSRLSDAQLTQPRAFHSATWIPELGAILFVGGYDRNSRPSTTADLYYPASDTVVTLASLLTEPRAHHTATWIPRTKEVLIAGGDMATGSGEVFRLWNPRTRGDCDGGCDGFDLCDAPQWLCDEDEEVDRTPATDHPATRVGRFLPLAQSMFHSRMQHTAVLLTATNDILLIGGLSTYINDQHLDAFRSTANCELFRGGGTKRRDWESV